MASRYYPQKDIDTFDKFNKELIGDLYSGKDGIINQTVVLYKVSAVDTETNMYGETAQGKVYKPGVQVACLIAADEQITQMDEFGPDLQQTAPSHEKTEVVENDDGSVDINFEPGAVAPETGDNHYMNLADLLPDSILDPLGSELYANYTDYKESRRKITE